MVVVVSKYPAFHRRTLEAVLRRQQGVQLLFPCNVTQALGGELAVFILTGGKGDQSLNCCKKSGRLAGYCCPESVHGIKPHTVQTTSVSGFFGMKSADCQWEKSDAPCQLWSPFV